MRRSSSRSTGTVRSRDAARTSSGSSGAGSSSPTLGGDRSRLKRSPFVVCEAQRVGDGLDLVDAQLPLPGLDKADMADGKPASRRDPNVTAVRDSVCRRPAILESIDIVAYRAALSADQRKRGLVSFGHALLCRWFDDLRFPGHSVSMTRHQSILLGSGCAKSSESPSVRVSNPPASMCGVLVRLSSDCAVDYVLRRDREIVEQVTKTDSVFID